MSLHSSIPPLISADSLRFNLEWVQMLFEVADVVWVGLSGGVDSHVLLHLLVSVITVKQRERLAVIHIHHGLNSNADNWLKHCENICSGLGVRFVAKRVVLKAQSSVEEAARNARYQAYEHVLGQYDVLLLAHHAGDQAETVLFRLLRGTGGKGLAGMSQERKLASARLHRPLLRVSKADILACAKQHALDWIEDESNNNETFTRNFLRRRVLPIVAERFPQLERNLFVTAKRISTDYEMLSELAESQLEAWSTPTGGLMLYHMRPLPLAKRLFWLQHFLKKKGVSLPYAQLASVDTMVFGAADKQPEFCFSSGRIMRHQNSVYLLPVEQKPQLGKVLSGQVFERAFDRVLVEGDGDFSLRERPHSALLMMPSGQHRKLKKWLNDQKVPSWWRAHLPYLYLDDELIAIGALWNHPDYLGVKVDWRLTAGLPFPLF